MKKVLILGGLVARPVCVVKSVCTVTDVKR